jgi:hypothetical protein
MDLKINFIFIEKTQVKKHTQNNLFQLSTVITPCDSFLARAHFRHRFRACASERLLQRETGAASLAV